MIPIWAFVGSVLVALCFLRRWQGALVACVMLANWALCKGLADVTGTQYNWQALAAIDFLSAFVLVGPAAALMILGFPPRLYRLAALIAVLYTAAMICHASYGLGDHGQAAIYRYWWRTHSILWGQAWLLLAWEALSGGRRSWRRRDHRRGGVPVVAHPDGAFAHRDAGR